MGSLKIRPISRAITLAGVCWITSLSAQAENASSARSGEQKLLEKIQQLEKRIAAMEADRKHQQESIQQQYISANEPELTARLKAVESRVNSQRKPVSIAEVGLTGVAQGLTNPGGNNNADSVKAFGLRTQIGF